MNIHVPVIGGAEPGPVVMAACGKQKKVVGAHGIDVFFPAAFLAGFFFRDFPGSIEHIEDIVLLQNPIRMRSGIDHGDIIGGMDPSPLHQLKISAHGTLHLLCQLSF